MTRPIAIVLFVVGCVAGLHAQTPPPLLLVSDGRPLGARSVGDPWIRSGDVLRGAGVGNELVAARALLPGDFHVEIDLALDRIDGTAASLRLGDSHLGFDGAGRKLFVEGPLFDGGPHPLGDTAAWVTAGRFFRCELTRVAGEVRVLIDGRELHRLHAPGRIEPVALRPHRNGMAVRRWRVRGATAPLPRPAAPGYTIPVVDISGHAERQVVVDREPGQYLGHPTTVLLEDGRTLIAVYPAGHGKGRILMKRSIDGGRTWSERLPTPPSFETSLEVPTIHRVVDPGGRKRLILFSGLYPIRMAVSEDDGHSWSELASIGDFGGIVAMGCVEPLRDGRHLALFHDDGRFIAGEGRRGPFRVYRTVSADGGLSWSAPEVIAEHPTAHLCEPGLVRSPDGRRLAVLLRENSRRFNAFIVFSDDEGETWTTPRELPAALTGDRHTGRYAPDGRLFLSFRDTTRASPTRGDWVGWVGTFDDLVAGREGQYRVRIMDNHLGADCAYPGVELLPDGTFVTTTYGHWTPDASPYIVTVRFTVSELDALLPR